MTRQDKIKYCVDKTMSFRNKNGIGNTSVIERIMFRSFAEKMKDNDLDKLYTEMLKFDKDIPNTNYGVDGL